MEIRTLKTQYFTATSLDGYIADENNSLDWLMQFGDGPEENSYSAFISEVGAIAMGSTTYDWVLDNDTFKDPDAPKPWPYEQPCWIFTTRDLRRVEGADIRFVKGDVAAVHKEMAAVAGDKNIWLAGGGELVGQFYDHGLLDELILSIAPVTLGAGAPLLPRRIVKPSLKLVSCKPLGDLFLEVRYSL